MNYFSTKNFLINEVTPYQLGFQTPASPYMHGIINLHHHIMFYLIMVLCFTFTMLYFTLKTFTINKTNNFTQYSQIKLLYNVRFSHHALLDIVWTIVPTIILILIALPSFALLYSFDYAVKAPHTILEVIGHQWYWSYEYTTIAKTFSKYAEAKYNFQFDSYMVPTEELKVGQLRLLSTTAPVILPVGQFIKCLITADDVLHSWAIPSLGVKMDAMPGRSSIVYVYMEAPGVYYGQCSELCGVNHGFMPIEIHGVHSFYYDLWVNIKIATVDSEFKPERIETAAETSFILIGLNLADKDQNFPFLTKNQLIEKYGEENFKEIINTWKQILPVMDSGKYSTGIPNLDPIFKNKFHYDYL